MIQKWTTGQAIFRAAPNGTKIGTIEPNMIVQSTGLTSDGLYSGKPITWEQVIHNGRTGWVYAEYLEAYADLEPDQPVQIENPNPDPNSARQYVKIDGILRHNLCGQFCAAFIGGDGIEAFVRKWKQADPIYYNLTMGFGADRTTGLDSLDSMLSVYGHPKKNLRFDTGLMDPILKRPIYTPGKVEAMLRDHFLIAGTYISPSGYLQKGGIGHWVVLVGVTPNKVNRGYARIYNPFHNALENYSWREFSESAASMNGLWVKRSL